MSCARQKSFRSDVKSEAASEVEDSSEHSEEDEKQEQQNNKARRMFKKLFSSNAPLAVFLKSVCEPTGECLLIANLLLRMLCLDDRICNLIAPPHCTTQHLRCFTSILEDPSLCEQGCSS